MKKPPGLKSRGLSAFRVRSDFTWPLQDPLSDVSVGGPVVGTEGYHDLVIVAIPLGFSTFMLIISSKTQPFQKASTMWFSSTSSE